MDSPGSSLPLRECGSPDHDELRGVELQAVAQLRAVGRVERCQFAHNLVAPKLVRRVRVDREQAHHLDRGLLPSTLRPGKEAHAGGEDVDDRRFGASATEPGSLCNIQAN